MKCSDWDIEKALILKKRYRSVPKERTLQIFNRPEYEVFIRELEDINSTKEFFDNFGYSLYEPCEDDDLDEYYCEEKAEEKLKYHIGGKYPRYIEKIKNPNDKKHNLNIAQLYLLVVWLGISKETYVPEYAEELSKINKSQTVDNTTIQELVDNTAMQDLEQLFRKQDLEICVRLWWNKEFFNGITLNEEIIIMKYMKCNVYWRKLISEYTNQIKDLIDLENDRRFEILTKRIDKINTDKMIKKIFNKKYESGNEEKYKNVLCRTWFKETDFPTLLELYLKLLKDKNYYTVLQIFKLSDRKKEAITLKNLIEIGYSKSFHEKIDDSIDNRLFTLPETR
ncbi:hypothetical protein [Hungatella hathewayi]